MHKYNDLELIFSLKLAKDVLYMYQWKLSVFVIIIIIIF